MEQEQPLTPEQPAAEPTLAQRLERQLAREAGEHWEMPASEPEPEQEVAVPDVETPETPPATEAEAQPTHAEIEIDGKTYQVPPELKDGYLRQSDYTKKTQQIAEERKSALEMRQAAEQALTVAQQMGPLLAEWHQRQQHAEQYQKVDWDALYQSDPLGHNKARIEAQENWQRLNYLGSQLQQAPTALKQLQAKAIAEETKRQLPKALELVPDLEARKSEFVDVGKSYGYSDDELTRITDARSIAMLRDLAEYKKLSANRDLVRQKVAAVPPVAKPGARAAAPKASANDYNAALRKVRTDRSDDSFVTALRLQRKLQGS